MPDVFVNDTGSIVMFMPMSAEARQWFDDNVASEGWQWLGASLGVDHRYADDLIHGLQGDGFSVAAE